MKRRFFIVLCFIATTFIAVSQPNIQKKSVRAPQNIRINGVLSEWSGQLQAHNRIDGIKYTISNDDENLYLTLVAPFKSTCIKAIRGGVTFTISKLTDNKREKDITKKSITFPTVKIAQYLSLFSNFETYFTYLRDTIKYKKNIDSLFRLTNLKANTLFNTIKIGDKRFPVNNSLGIIAAAQFNKKMDLIYELSVPIKYLDLDLNSNQPFSYNIGLSGQPEEVANRKVNTNIAGPTPPPGISSPAPSSDEFLTDFWGEYVLISK
jgi:hypothetical protein